jgi:hypothetical protein
MHVDSERAFDSSDVVWSLRLRACAFHMELESSSAQAHVAGAIGELPRRFVEGRIGVIGDVTLQAILDCAHDWASSLLLGPSWAVHHQLSRIFNSVFHDC